MNPINATSAPQASLPPMPGQPVTAAQHPAVTEDAQASEAPMVVSLKHRPSGNVFPFNPEMAESEDVVGVDQFGNEVANAPFPGSMQDPTKPTTPQIMGYVTHEEHQTLLARIGRLEQELNRQAQIIHAIQNPNLNMTG